MKYRKKPVVVKEAGTMGSMKCCAQVQKQKASIDATLEYLAGEVQTSVYLVYVLEELADGSFAPTAAPPEVDPSTIDSAIDTIAKRLAYSNKRLEELIGKLRGKIGETKVL